MERKLCPNEETCGAEGFCITATSGSTSWPCQLAEDLNLTYDGNAVEIYQNGNLIAGVTMHSLIELYI